MAKNSTRPSSKAKPPQEPTVSKISETDPAITEIARHLFSLRESFKCGICLDLISAPSRLDCGHSFCTPCLKHFLSVERKGQRKRTSVSCPACNRPGITKRSLNQKDVGGAQDDILNSFTASATVALTRLEECLEKTTGIDFAKVKCASDRRKNLAGTKEAPSPPKRPTSSVTKKPKQKKDIEEDSDDILGCPSDSSQWSLKREARPRTYGGGGTNHRPVVRSNSPVFDEIVTAREEDTHDDKEKESNNFTRSNSPEIVACKDTETNSGAVRSNSPELDDMVVDNNDSSQDEQEPTSSCHQGAAVRPDSLTDVEATSAEPKTASNSARETDTSDSVVKLKSQDLQKALVETSFVSATSWDHGSSLTPSDTSVEPTHSKKYKKKVLSSEESGQDNPEKRPSVAAPNSSSAVADICRTHGLKDVDLEYSDAEYQNLTSHKLFQQNYYSLIQTGNPGVARAKVIKLVAAKWKEFQTMAADAASKKSSGGKSSSGRKTSVRQQKTTESDKKKSDAKIQKNEKQPHQSGVSVEKGQKRGTKRAAEQSSDIPDQPHEELSKSGDQVKAGPVFQFRKMGRIKQMERVASVSESPKRARRIPFIQKGLLAPMTAAEQMRQMMTEDLPSLQQIVETSRRRRSGDAFKTQVEQSKSAILQHDEPTKSPDKVATEDVAKDADIENLDPSPNKKRSLSDDHSPPTKEFKRRKMGLDETTPPRAAFDRSLHKLDRRTSTMIQTPTTERVIGRSGSNTSTPTSTSKFNFKPADKLSKPTVRLLDTVDLEMLGEEEEKHDVESKGEEVENGSSEELDKAAPASTSLLSGSSGRISSNRPRPEPSKKDGSAMEGITPLAPPPPPSSVHDMEVGEIETELEKLKQSIKTSDLFGQKKKKAAHESWQDTVLVTPPRRPKEQVPAAKSMDSEEEATMMQEILEDESNRTQQRVTTTNIDEGSSSDDDSDDMFSATPEHTVNRSKRIFGTSSINKSKGGEVEKSPSKAKRSLLVPVARTKRYLTPRKDDEQPNNKPDLTSTSSPSPPKKMTLKTKLFKNVEVCFVTALATATSARRDLAKTVRDGGGHVFDSVPEMSFESGTVSVAIADPALDLGDAPKEREFCIARLRKEHNRKFATSNVAVVSKDWVTASVEAGKILPLRRFLQHEATVEALRRADYPEHLCK